MSEFKLARPIDINLGGSMETLSGEKTLYEILRGFTGGISSSDGVAGSPLPPLVERMRESFSKQAPHIGEACRNSGQDLIRWTREGGPLRALLVISVGTMALLVLTGLLAFTVFFLVATANAIIISALLSLAAIGGFLALFFALLTAFYVGALSLAIFVISITTISVIISVIVATGWIGFVYVVWLSAKKSMGLIKKSLSIASSAVSVYSSSGRDRHECDTSLKSPLVEVK